jgi:hypothetical protein
VVDVAVVRVTQTLHEVLPPEREGHFQTRVAQLARAFGWRVYHPWLSMHSASGWPDLFMVRDERALAVELKTERGRDRLFQKDWLDDLGRVPGIDVPRCDRHQELGFWRPSDWDDIVVTLR